MSNILVSHVPFGHPQARYGDPRQQKSQCHYCVWSYVHIILTWGKRSQHSLHLLCIGKSVTCLKKTPLSCFALFSNVVIVKLGDNLNFSSLPVFLLRSASEVPSKSALRAVHMVDAVTYPSNWDIISSVIATSLVTRSMVSFLFHTFYAFSSLHRASTSNCERTMFTNGVMSYSSKI